MLMIATLTR